MTCNRTALAALVFAAFLAGSPAAATEGPDAPARRGLDPARALLYFHAPAVVAHTAHASVQAPIPAFARMYRTACSTCHTQNDCKACHVSPAPGSAERSARD